MLDSSLVLLSILQQGITSCCIKKDWLSQESECHACIESIMNQTPGMLIPHSETQMTVQESHGAKILSECSLYLIFSMLHVAGLQQNTKKNGGLKFIKAFSLYLKVFSPYFKCLIYS